MLWGSPCMCMRHTAALRRATVSSAPGARKAITSFIMAAPAAIAARITSGFRVSTETGTSRTSASITGTTRRISSSAGTACARAGGFPANIQYIGALFAQLERVGNRGLRVVQPSTVRK